MQSCDSNNFKRVTDSYDKTYRYVDYNDLNPLQKELIAERSGLWFILHNIYYNIPVCKHPVGVDSLTKFINYLILTEPEKVRDFWLYATFFEVLNELTENTQRYFAHIYIDDEQGFVFTGKSVDVVNVPDEIAAITIDDALRKQLSVLPNPAGQVTTWAEFQKINGLQPRDVHSKVTKSGVDDVYEPEKYAVVAIDDARRMGAEVLNNTARSFNNKFVTNSVLFIPCSKPKSKCARRCSKRRYFLRQ